MGSTFVSMNPAPLRIGLFDVGLAADRPRLIARLLRLTALLALLLSVMGSAGAQTRERSSLDRGWAFHLGDASGAQEVGFEARTWRRLDLPHDWSIELPVDPSAPSGGGGGFFPTGIGWYRRTIAAPSSWTGRRVAIEFEGVSAHAEVWINGVKLGMHPYAYTSFRYDLTGYLKLGADNVLAVRVDNSRQPNSRWYSGSGLYRHVWLEVTDPVHVAPNGVFISTTELTPAAAKLRVETMVRNDTPAAVELEIETLLIDPTGRQVANVRTPFRTEANATATLAPTMTLTQPQTWSVDTPRLYRAVTRVRSGDRVTDEVKTDFGVRTLEVSAARGFRLNGRTLELVGGNVHHDNGILGAAAFDRAEERKAQLMKAAGFNAVRTAHNPPSTAFLAACDRIGLLVIEEAFDGWEKSKTAHDYGRSFKEWALRDLSAMVLRDRNHPSVVMWSTGNEVYERGNASGARIAEMLAAQIRELDRSRPITAGLNGMGPKGDWTKVDPVFATLEVAGYNYEIARHADDHARLPGRVILAAESYQSETFANWAIAHDHDYVIGDFVWSGIDYLGEAGIGRVFPPDEPVRRHWEGSHFPWHGAACGDIDLTGYRKPISHYRAIVWDRGEKLYAAVRVPSPDERPWNVSPWTVTPARASWTWPGEEGREFEVEVYSRHEAVRLYLNGQRLGEKPTTRAEQFRAVFKVQYTAGELSAVGLQGGREVETLTLKTAGAPDRMRLVADQTRLRANGQDLVFATLDVLDEHGVPNPTSNVPVEITIEGPAVLAGFGNADLTSTESYRSSRHRLFEGRALAIARTTHASGPIKITASSPGLRSATVVLESLDAAP